LRGKPRIRTSVIPRSPFGTELKPLHILTGIRDVTTGLREAQA
jgi:hypothetical protein